MGQYKGICMFILVLLMMPMFLSCSEKEKDRDMRFMTPRMCYTKWLEASMVGDMQANAECMTKPSQRFMDLQSKERDVFIGRMISSAQVFKNYSVVDEKIKGDKAIILIKEPKSGHSIAVPFQLENGSWKVDLIAMFSM